MMRECGITFRTSIQWSRVMTDREGTINPEGLAFYDRLVDALIANGIQPMLCLLPLIFQCTGWRRGFEQW